MSIPVQPNTGRALEPAASLAPRTCTPAEYARAVGTGVNRVREYIREGKVRAVRHGRRLVIPISEIDRFLADQAGEGK